MSNKLLSIYLFFCFLAKELQILVDLAFTSGLVAFQMQDLG